VDAGSVRSILGRAINRLVLLLRLIDPFASYRIYDIKYSQFMGCRGLFEVSVDLLNQYGFGLQEAILVSRGQSGLVPAGHGYDMLSYLDVVHAESGQ
jgi:hypothetical protein